MAKPSPSALSTLLSFRTELDGRRDEMTKAWRESLALTLEHRIPRARAGAPPAALTHPRAPKTR